jgi:hypothetical protein
MNATQISITAAYTHRLVYFQRLRMAFKSSVLVLIKAYLWVLVP